MPMLITTLAFVKAVIPGQSISILIPLRTKQRSPAAVARRITRLIRLSMIPQGFGTLVSFPEFFPC